MIATLLLLLGLGSTPPTADVARWRELLHDRQAPLQQSQAALLLVTAREPEAAEVVRQGLKQTEVVDVFTALCAALRTAQDSRFVEELFAALASPRPAVRLAAAETLAALASPTLVARLRALGQDSKAEMAVRQAAVTALGRTGRPEAASALIELLALDSEVLRKSVTTALSELTGQTYGPDIERWRNWWEKHRAEPAERWLADRLAYQAGRARRLEGDVERLRGQVVQLHEQLYARLPPADRLGYIQALLDQEEAAVRALAVPWGLQLLPALDATGLRALTDVLLRLSQDSAPDIQRSAVLALGRVTDPRAFDRLRQLTRSPAPAIRASAARGLAIQSRGSGPEAQARQRQAVPILQQALDDPAVEVVIEAAEALGGLGVTEAGPVLAALLRHASPQVRQTAAQALERVADATVLESLLEGLDDPAVSVRFSLLGALAHAAPEGTSLSDAQRERLFARLETVLLRDADPGVRSRAATVLGDCGGAAALPALWKRIQAGEEGRVQEKAWAAMIDVLARSASLPLLHQWDRALTEARQPARRAQLLTEVHARWQKRDDLRTAADGVLEALVQAQLDQGKWSAAFPHVRDLLNRAAGDADMDRRLRWLLAVGEQALREGNTTEALRAVREAQAPLARRGQLAAEFQRLEKQAREE